MDIYLKNGKKDFLLDDIVLLYSIYSVRVLFKTERLEMEEGQDFRGSAIGTVILSVKGGEVYGSLEFNHLRFRPLFRLPVALKLTPTLSGNASSHSFAPTILNLLTIVLVLSSCARYVNIPNTELDMFLDMFK